MLFLLVLRDFKIRFKQSYLGLSWAFFQPLATTLVFSVILGKNLGVEFAGPYPLFFLSGLLAWNYFSKVFSSGTLSIVNEAELVKKIYFPKLILPLYQALSALTDLIIALTIFFILCFFYDWPISSNIIFLPFFLCLAMIFAVAVSLWLGPINVRFRDIQIALPLVQQLLFIITPIMYPWKPSSPNTNFDFITSLNPLTGIVEGFRFCLLGVGTPFSIGSIISYAAIVILFLGGLVFFNASQEKFADIL